MSDLQVPQAWRILPWDTEFFGFTIARIDKPLNREELDAYARWADAENVQCTYYLCPVQALEAIHLAQQQDFQFYDVRVQLRLKVPFTISDVQDTTLRSATIDDLPALQELASQLHEDTRFVVDPGFPAAKALGLYRLWMKKDLSDTQGVVLVKSDSANKPVAYLTCQAKNQVGNIGLFGVAADYQNRGIGKALLKEGIRWFQQNGCTSVEVVTQGRNLAALSSYTSHGFRIESQGLWLHRWRRSNLDG